MSIDFEKKASSKCNAPDKTFLFIKDKSETFICINDWAPKNVIDNLRTVNNMISENDRTTLCQAISGIKETCYYIHLTKNERLWGNKK